MRQRKTAILMLSLLLATGCRTHSGSTSAEPNDFESTWYGYLNPGQEPTVDDVENFHKKLWELSNSDSRTVAPHEHSMMRTVSKSWPGVIRKIVSNPMGSSRGCLNQPHVSTRNTSSLRHVVRAGQSVASARHCMAHRRLAQTLFNLLNQTPIHQLAERNVFGHLQALFGELHVELDSSVGDHAVVGKRV